MDVEEVQPTGGELTLEVEQLDKVAIDASVEEQWNTKKWINAWYILLTRVVEQLNLEWWSYAAYYMLLAGLLLSFYTANYQTKALISVLTDEWKMSLFAGVIISDFYEGAKDVLAVFTAWLADAYFGESWTRLYKAMIYAVGLLLWEHMPSDYVAGLFIPGLLLIIAGQSGYEQDYTICETEDEGNNDDGKQERKAEQQHGSEREQWISRLFTKARKHLWLLIKTYWIRTVGFIIVVFLIPYENNFNFLIPAVMLIASSGVFFLAGKLSFLPFKRPEGSPFTVILQVFLAAFKKRHNDNILRTSIYFGNLQSQSSDKPTENHIPDHEDQINFTDQLRCLNRAALYNSEREDPKIELESKRLCTVQHVEDTKRFTKNILLSLVFVLYGIMSTVGDTLFIQQVEKMDAMLIGSREVPVQLYVLGPEAVRKLVSYLCNWIRSKQVEASRSRFNGTYRIGLGMLLSIPCFGIAYSVEAQRLEAINDQVNISSSTFAQKKHISTSNLLPQLILLGIMDGLAIDGIACFFTQEMPDYIADSYATVLAEGIVGIGKLLSVVWFSIWYYGTKTIGGESWFGETINESHVDYYYVAMAIFGFVSFIIYAWVAFKHSQMKRSSQTF